MKARQSSSGRKVSVKTPSKPTTQSRNPPNKSSLLNIASLSTPTSRQLQPSLPQQRVAFNLITSGREDIRLRQFKPSSSKSQPSQQRSSHYDRTIMSIPHQLASSIHASSSTSPSSMSSLSSSVQRKFTTILDNPILLMKRGMASTQSTSRSSLSANGGANDLYTFPEPTQAELQLPLGDSIRISTRNEIIEQLSMNGPAAMKPRGHRSRTSSSSSSPRSGSPSQEHSNRDNTMGQSSMLSSSSSPSSNRGSNQQQPRQQQQQQQQRPSSQQTLRNQDQDGRDTSSLTGSTGQRGYGSDSGMQQELTTLSNQQSSKRDGGDSSRSRSRASSSTNTSGSSGSMRDQSSRQQQQPPPPQQQQTSSKAQRNIPPIQPYSNESPSPMPSARARQINVSSSSSSSSSPDQRPHHLRSVAYTPIHEPRGGGTGDNMYYDDGLFTRNSPTSDLHKSSSFVSGDHTRRSTAFQPTPSLPQRRRLSTLATTSSPTSSSSSYDRQRHDVHHDLIPNRVVEDVMMDDTREEVISTSSELDRLRKLPSYFRVHPKLKHTMAYRRHYVDPPPTLSSQPALTSPVVLPSTFENSLRPPSTVIPSHSKSSSKTRSSSLSMIMAQNPPRE